LEFECVQKDDEAAAKWLKLVSSCGLFFSPNIQMGVHIYHIHTYIWLYIYVHACIFFLLFILGSFALLAAEWKMNLRIFGILFYRAAVWHVACGMWQVACGTSS